MQDETKLYASADGEFEPEADDMEELEGGFGEDEEEEEISTTVSSDDDELGEEDEVVGVVEVERASAPPPRKPAAPKPAKKAREEGCGEEGCATTCEKGGKESPRRRLRRRKPQRRLQRKQRKRRRRRRPPKSRQRRLRRSPQRSLQRKLRRRRRRKRVAASRCVESEPRGRSLRAALSFCPFLFRRAGLLIAWDGCGGGPVMTAGGEVESVEDQTRALAAGVGVFKLDVDGAPLAGHERDVVVVVERGHDQIAGFRAHGFHADQQRRRFRDVVQVGGQDPLGALAVGRGISSPRSRWADRGCL